MAMWLMAETVREEASRLELGIKKVVLGRILSFYNNPFSRTASSFLSTDGLMRERLPKKIGHVSTHPGKRTCRSKKQMHLRLAW